MVLLELRKRRDFPSVTNDQKAWKWIPDRDGTIDFVMQKIMVLMAISSKTEQTIPRQLRHRRGERRCRKSLQYPISIVWQVQTAYWIPGCFSSAHPSQDDQMKRVNITYGWPNTDHSSPPPARSSRPTAVRTELGNTRRGNTVPSVARSRRNSPPNRTESKEEFLRGRDSASSFTSTKK